MLPRFEVKFSQAKPVGLPTFRKLVIPQVLPKRIYWLPPRDIQLHPIPLSQSRLVGLQGSALCTLVTAITGACVSIDGRFVHAEQQ